MITKTPLGVSFFDEAHGGVYRGRSALVSGRADTGKTVMGFQFILEGLRLDERCLMLSTQQAADLTICADSLGMPISQAVASEDLILLEYSDFVFGMDRADSIMLPPDGFTELQEIIEANAIRRVVVDTVVPWVAINEVGHLGQHVLSFSRAFDRLGATTLMTLPKPVSAMAHKLRKVLEEVIPICIYLSPGDEEDTFVFQVAKYLGEKNPGPPIPYRIEDKVGLTAIKPKAAAATAVPVAAPPPAAPPARAPTAAPAAAPSAQPAQPAKPRISFSSVVPVLRPEEMNAPEREQS